MIAIETARVGTPIGRLVLAARDGQLVALHFGDRPDTLARDLERRFGPCVLENRPDPAGAVTRLRAYFAGDLRAIDAIPADPGGTPFQRRVWDELRRIPVGTTVSYSELARRVGVPGTVRAVGTANGRNPVAVVIPCHRVIGADGSLTGYGGGLDRKQWLLAHEGAATPRGQGLLPMSQVSVRSTT
jgi:methylated-DNA-[protein]-cysteine S-methyltransferase